VAESHHDFYEVIIPILFVETGENHEIPVRMGGICADSRIRTFWIRSRNTVHSTAEIGV